MNRRKSNVQIWKDEWKEEGLQYLFRLFGDCNRDNLSSLWQQQNHPKQQKIFCAHR